MSEKPFICYWKVERPDATWHRIEDTPEARALAIRNGAMFITTPSLSHEPGPGLPEPTRRGDLILDADDKQEPQNAHAEIRRLCCVYLPEHFGLDPWDMKFFCSGSKGFHAEIPARFFGLEGGDPFLPLIYKKIVSGWVDELGLTTLDLSVYNMGRGRMWRLPNVRRSNGRMKVSLSRDDVAFCSYDELWALSEAPGGGLTMQDLKSVVQRVQSEIVAERIAGDKPSLTISNLSTDTPPCVKHILTAMPPKSKHVDFNKLSLNLACYLKARGYTLQGALGIVGDFIEKYSDSETHDTPAKRKTNFESVWKSIQTGNEYQFDCSFILGLHLPGSAFDCKKCPVKRNADAPAPTPAEAPNGNTQHVSPPPAGDTPGLQPEKKAIVKGIAAQPVREDQPRVLKRDPLAFPQVMSGVAERYAGLYSSYLEPPKQFFYMAFLACLGAHLNQRIFIRSSIRCPARPYMVLLGASADDRKSTACDQTIEFFRNSFLDDFPVCRGVGSAEGLQKRLCGESERLLLYYDEFKAFVSKCRIDGSVLLPCVNTLFESDRYESQTKKTKINIENGALTMLAASTADTYQSTWSQQFTDIGFNNRLWLVTGAGQRKFAFPKPIPDLDRINLQAELKGISLMVGDRLEIDIADDARRLHQDWYMGLESSIHSKRLDGYALRFMQLLAVNDMKRVIDLETVLKTIALCDWQLQVRKLNDPIGADNAIARLEQNIQRQLEMRGDLLESALMKHVNARNAGLFFYQNAISNLEKAGLIEQFMYRKKRHFRFVSDLQEEALS